MSERTPEGLREAVDETIACDGISPDDDGVNRVRGDLVLRAIVEYGGITSVELGAVVDCIAALIHVKGGESETTERATRVAAFVSLLLDASEVGDG